MKKSLIALFVASVAVSAQATATAKTLPTEPYVVDGYTPDTRTAEAKETYANRVIKSDVEGNNHSVFGQDNTVLAEHGSSSNFGNQNVIGADAKDGNIFGDGSSITGLQAQAYGDNNHLKGEQNSAFGMNNVVTGDHSHAIGGGNNLTGSRATAVGHYNLITSDEATAVGYDNKAHVRGVAVGYTNNATNHGVAIGVETKATGESATAIGVRANSTGLSTISIGSDANANKIASTAIGQGANADASYGVALGKAATVTHGSSVALGTATTTEQAVAVTEATVGKITYGGFVGTDATAVVSVGKKGDHTRQIINVGAGEISATSTDAINGSQLYATNDAVNNIGTTVVNVLGGNADLDSKGNITMTNVGGTGENTVHDAIKHNADKIAENTVNITTNANNIADNSVRITTNEGNIANNAQRITTNEGNIATNTAYIKAVEAKLPVVKAGDNTTVDVTVDAYGKATYTVSSKDFQPAIDANTAKIADNAKAISTNTADIRSAEKLIDKNAKDIAQNTSDIRDNAGKIADNANNIADNVANITHNSARINAVEIEAKKHSVVKAGKNTTVNKTTGANGEAVYTVDANVDHLATKAEVNKHVGAINSRIDGVEGKVAQNTKAIGRLDHDVRKNRKRADAGTASVAAMANIPQVYLPGKSGVGVGVGYKHGQSAIAVGYSRTSDNAHHIIKLSVGADSQKDVTVGAGYMYQW
nr:MAG TPA: hypothetical protein [Caudoviricetes sp.]